MTQTELREKLIKILIRYANVPAAESSILAQDADEVTAYATQAELFADSPANGTIAYCTATGDVWFRRSGKWVALNNAAVTSEALTIPVDYNLAGAAVLPAGTLFSRQAEIDAYLAAAGTTAFKYVSDVYDATPVVLTKNITINVAAGVQRPRAGQANGIAWAFTSKIPAGGLLNLFGAPPSTWNTVIAAQVVTASQPGSGDPYVDVAGTPFAGNLKGWMAVFSTGQTAVIHDHTTSRLYLLNTLSPVPTNGVSTVTVKRPSTILRNSFTDGTIAYSQNTVMLDNGGISGFNDGGYSFRDIAIDTTGNNGNAFLANQIRLTATRVILDGRAWAEDFGQPLASGNVLNVGNANVFFDTSSIVYPLAGSNHYVLRGSNLLFFDTYASGPRFGYYVQENGRFSIIHSVLDNFGTSPGEPDEGAVHVTSGAVFDSQDRSPVGFTDKHNEIRNVPTAVGAVYLQTGLQGRTRFYGVRMKNCTGPCFRLGAGAQLHLTPANQVGGLIDGGGNLDVGIYMEGPNSGILIDALTSVTGALGDVRMDGEIFSYAQILAARAATSQPGGTLAAVLRVDEVEDGTAIGNGTLAYTAAGNLLTYAAPGDAAGAAVTLLVTGGVFSLRSSNGKTIRLYAKAVAALPGANTSQTFAVAHSAKASRAVNGSGNVADKPA